MALQLSLSSWLVVSVPLTLSSFPSSIPSLPCRSLSQATNTTLRYHMGTAGFGSLIIAIVKTIRAVIAYMQKQAKASKNKILEYLMCVLQCCMWCLEKCLKFLNKNAYIQTAIYGFSFCKSARRAFFLILRNILRVAAVNIVADFVLILGKVLTPLILFLFVLFSCMFFCVLLVLLFCMIY